MQNLKEKLNKIEKKIFDKKIDQKKRELEFREERKKAKNEIDKIWKKEFRNNLTFISSLKETLDTFKKLDQNLNYEYIINDKDDGHNSFQILEIKFILANISVDIRIPVVDIKIANIQIYINHDIDARAIDYDPEHIKNFKLNETSKAKDFYFNKILEIFEQLQE